MNTERLLRLAAHLDTVPVAEFEMCNWARRTDCGTVACALGHACSIPEFCDAGLRLAWEPAVPGMVDELASVEFGCGYGTGFDVAAAFFGIDIEDAYLLFNPREYPDANGDPREDIRPAEVAARIRDLVATKAGAA